MFDVGFSELVVCFIIALVVLGPERLPKVARAVGRWTGMAKSYMRNLSTELDRESQASELKKQIAEANQLIQEQADALKNASRKIISDSSKPP